MLEIDWNRIYLEANISAFKNCEMILGWIEDGKLVEENMKRLKERHEFLNELRKC